MHFLLSVEEPTEGALLLVPSSHCPPRIAPEFRPLGLRGAGEVRYPLGCSSCFGPAFGQPINEAKHVAALVRVYATSQLGFPISVPFHTDVGAAVRVVRATQRARQRGRARPVCHRRPGGAPLHQRCVQRVGVRREHGAQVSGREEKTKGGRGMLRLGTVCAAPSPSRGHSAQCPASCTLVLPRRTARLHGPVSFATTGT